MAERHEFMDWLEAAIGDGTVTIRETRTYFIAEMDAAPPAVAVMVWKRVLSETERTDYHRAALSPDKQFVAAWEKATTSVETLTFLRSHTSVS